MENKEYYIKYLDNQPVSIETAYNSNGENRNRPLTTAAHLVAAYKAASTIVIVIDLLSTLRCYLRIFKLDSLIGVNATDV